MRYYWGIKNTVTNEYYSYQCPDQRSVFCKDITYALFFTSKEGAEKFAESCNCKNCKPVKIKAIYEEIKE